MKRNIVLRILLILLVVSLSAFIGCSDKQSTAKEISVSFDETSVFELGDDIQVPKGILLDKDSNEVLEDITYIFTKPGGEKVSSIFPSIHCDKVGEWSVEYSYESISVKKKFKVQDTVAPVITLTKTPSDVFVGNPEGYSFPIETIQIDDLSPIDYSSVIYDFRFNGAPVANFDGETFYATEEGEFTFAISLKDIYGNSATSETIKWNSKLKDWVDSDISQEYLASYDKKGYINTVCSGDMSEYWASSPYETWYETYNGANGVLCVEAEPFGNYRCIGFKFNLQKTLSMEEAKDKVVIIKLLTEANVKEIYFGGTKWITEIECAENYPISIQKGEWNYLVINYADMERCHYFDEGENGFNAFQIGFGLAQVSPMAGNCKLYIDYVSIAENLEDVKNIIKTNQNELTWDAVENATSYTVTENGVKTIVNENKYVPISFDNVITVIANGDNLQYISSENAMPYIDTSAMEENVLADFNSKAYEYMAYKSSIPYRDADTIETEYMGTSDGRTGVLKVTTTNNEAFGFNKGIGDFVLKFPKSSNGVIKINMKIESLNTETLAFTLVDSEKELSVSGFNIESREWQTIEINLGNSAYKDRIAIMLTNGDYKEDSVFYFDSVIDLPLNEILETLAENVEGNYLADFSSEDYEKTVRKSQIVCRDAETLTAEYMDTFGGATNVLKITTTNNEIDEGKGIGDFIIHLPVKATKKIKVRFKIEKCVAEYIYFAYPGTEDSMFDINAGSSDWQEVELSYEGLENKGTIDVIIQGGLTGEENIFYFDYVLEVEEVPLNEILETLAESVEEDYLADFSSKDYEYTVKKSDLPYRDAETLTVEYKDSYSGATNVLKITTTNNEIDEGKGIGDFIIHLPVKASKKIKVRFKVEKCVADYIYFAYPGTEDSMFDINTGSSDWQEVELIYEGLQNKGTIDVLIQGGLTGEENIFYFDYVYEEIIVEKEYDGEDVAMGDDKQEDPFGQDKEWDL